MTEPKPKRLQFKTHLQVIRNSVGTEMFRNWYVRTPAEGEFDAMRDGEDSCAFYVSGLLKIFDKISSAHGTVNSVIKDLKESGWVSATDPRPGDVLVWEAQKFGNKLQKHIGFYMGNSKAISTSWEKKIVVEHDYRFDGTRKIENIYRMDNWDEDNP